MFLEKNNSTGFTIVELLLVIAIMSLLSSIVMVSTKGIRERSNNSKIQSEMNSIFKEVSLHYNEETGYSGFVLPSKYDPPRCSESDDYEVNTDDVDHKSFAILCNLCGEESNWYLCVDYTGVFREVNDPRDGAVSCSGCQGADITQDGKVDLNDLGTIASQWGQDDCSGGNSWCQGADITQDGKVDLNDLGTIASQWGQDECLK